MGLRLEMIKLRLPGCRDVINELFKAFLPVLEKGFNFILYGGMK